MQTALIRVEGLPGGLYQASLAFPADGLTSPDPDAPRVTFAALPQPSGAADLATLVSDTLGSSDEFVTMGQALYDTVLRDDIHDALTAAKAGPDGVRLLFDIVPDELKTVPWELLRHDTQRLFTDARHPAARVASTYTTEPPPQELCWPLRVMVVVGTKDTKIGVDEEIRHIKDAFRSVCGFVDLEVLRLPSRERLRDECEAMKPHVFHFIGHGGTDDVTGGFLRLEQRDGSSRPWTAADVRDDLAAAPPRVAMLNACHSGARERAGTWAAAAGLAALNVPAVVAMQGPIRGDAAARLAKGFFGSLARGHPLDVAMAKARVAVTDVAGDRQREYALPCLILGAPPEHILDLSADPTSKLVQPLHETVFFVDRLPNRRFLWDRLVSTGERGPRILAVTGPTEAGKGSLVRWGLGVAHVRGHPVAHAALPADDAVDSGDFLDLLSEALPAEVVALAPEPYRALRADIATFRFERARARLDRRPFEGTPRDLYARLRNLLATLSSEGSLVIGIDGIDGVERGEWQAYAVPELLEPIARGRVGGVRLLVSLKETERRVRFPVQHFPAGTVEDFPLQLFPGEEMVDLLTQWLRANNYAESSFQADVENLQKDLVGRPWTTAVFGLLRMKASVAQWPTEP